MSSNVFFSLKKVFDTNSALTLDDIYQEAKAGDKVSNIIINNASEYIGTGLADFVNVFDPGVVILGGEVVAAFQELMYDGIVRTTRLKAMNPIFSQTQIKRSAISGTSSSLGAAVMIIERYLGSGMLNIRSISTTFR